ncbi:MAG: glucosamine-6-phosphate deaminase, partial [Spirochaetae bacterium HGW-Spirochaetae-9]
MNIGIFENSATLGRQASDLGTRAIREAIAARGEANIILATAASQFPLLDCLVREPGIDWSRVTCFHLDEYIGIPESHPASFRSQMKERVVKRLPSLRKFHYIEADALPLQKEIDRLNEAIRRCP